jgi:Sigma-70 region 2
MVDAEFIKKFRAGDPTIYKQVFDIYYKDLLKYANRFLNDVESSQDLVQEVYCYIWKKRSALNPVHKREDYPEMPPQNYLSEETRKAVAEYMLTLTK